MHVPWVFENRELRLNRCSARNSTSTFSQGIPETLNHKAERSALLVKNNLPDIDCPYSYVGLTSFWGSDFRY